MVRTKHSTIVQAQKRQHTSALSRKFTTLTSPKQASWPQVQMSRADSVLISISQAIEPSLLPSQIKKKQLMKLNSCTKSRFTKAQLIPILRKKISSDPQKAQLTQRECQKWMQSTKLSLKPSQIEARSRDTTALFLFFHTQSNKRSWYYYIASLNDKAK